MPPFIKMNPFDQIKDVVGVCLFLTLLTTPTLSRSDPATEVVPLKNIEILASAQAVPEWKQLWDQARNFTASGKTSQAIASYGKLFDRKPQLEQASWEYCQLLRLTGDSKTASRVIAGLIERKPGNQEYLLAGGAISLDNQDWQTAAKYFGRFLEMEPVGDRADTAMLGLMQSLRGQGRRDLAMTVAERMLARRGADLSFLRETLEEAVHLGQPEKAKRLLRQLAVLPELDDTTIGELVAAFDGKEFAEEKAILCERFLKRHPGFLPYRRKLAAQYLETARFDDALRHLYFLVEQKEASDADLLLTGRLAYHHARRPDKALAIFERYVGRVPQDQEALAELVAIRQSLAEDFVSIVENDGARFLWEDLPRVTAQRKEIFKQLAEILTTKEGGGKNVLEVLSIINEHHPDDAEIGIKLARHHYAERQYHTALTILDRLEPKRNLDASYHLLRAEISLALGEALESLGAMEAALQQNPADQEVRFKAVRLAGRLGDPRRMKDLFENSDNTIGKRQVDGQGLFFYLEQLQKNYLFGEFDQVVNRFAIDSGSNLPKRDSIDLLRAGNLQRQGKPYEAEQILRSMLVEQRSTAEVVLQLVENALAEGNLDDAGAWFTLIKDEGEQGPQRISEEHRRRKFLLELRLARLQGRIDRFQDLLENHSSFSDSFGKSPEQERFLAQIALEKCWLSWGQGDRRETVRLLSQVPSKGKEFADYYVLLSLGEKDDLSSESSKAFTAFANVAPELRLQILPVIVEELLSKQLYASAQGYLRQLLLYNGNSVLARILEAKLALARGRYEESKKLFLSITKRFPEEEYFITMSIGIALRTGDYLNGLAIWESSYGEVGQQQFGDISTMARGTHDFGQKLALARLLWGAKRQEKSLEVYRHLLYPAVETVIKDRFRQHQIAYSQPIEERKWWDTLWQLVQSTPDIVVQLMEPKIFLANLGNEVSAIVTEYYSLFRGQKTIVGEYLARKAIVDRNYAAAELRSKQMVEEQQSPEGMIDLAAIYGRIGKYRKEAQVYEALQNSGTTSPEIQASMEHSSQQLSPQNALDVGHQEKQGRSGIIDLQTTQLGSSFRITPNFDSEVFVAYTNSRYQSEKSRATAHGNTLYVSTMYDLSKDYELRVGGGGHKMEDDSDLLVLHEIGIKGRLDQYFSVSLDWLKGLVDDNVASLRAQETYQQFDAGINCETPIGVNFGGDFRHRNYSDENTQNRFHSFAAYGIYGDSINLVARYDYQYLINSDSDSEAAAPDSAVPEGQDTLDQLYWKPSFWSEHLWGVSFRQDFFGFLDGSHRRNSYYSIANAVGFDDGDSLSYQGKFDIFLEMSPHFLLKGNFTFSKGDQYEEKGLAFSLQYRW